MSGRARRADPQNRGNLVLAETAHPAFDKASRLMDLEVRRVPVASDYRAAPAAMADAMDGDTILLVGSAPCFPFGIIDPVEELSELACRSNVWLHVDACVGGYFLPFFLLAGGVLRVLDDTQAVVPDVATPRTTASTLTYGRMAASPPPRSSAPALAAP